MRVAFNLGCGMLGGWLGHRLGISLFDATMACVVAWLVVVGIDAMEDAP